MYNIGSTHKDLEPLTIKISKKEEDKRNHMRLWHLTQLLSECDAKIADDILNNREHITALRRRPVIKDEIKMCQFMLDDSNF